MTLTQSVLQTICKRKQRDIAVLKDSTDITDLEAQLIKANSSFLSALREPLQAPKMARVVAELKPRSPSAGDLQPVPDVESLISAYSQHASAISVLTDEHYFGGSFDLLRQVKSLTALPVLCKDFILDPLQVLLARQAGADAVLLIVKAITDDNLNHLYKLILDWGMIPVVEVQNADELSRSLALNPEVILINHRNLDTLAMDRDTVLNLVPMLLHAFQGVVIAASGIDSRSDIQRLLPATQCFLVGTSLMTSPKPAVVLASLVGAFK